MKKKILVIIVFLSLIILNVILLFKGYLNYSNQRNYFRIHIVANSNSFDDQIIKLAVSKNVNNYINNLQNNDTNTKTNSKDLITNNINNILSIAKDTLNELDTTYQARAKIGKIQYQEKTNSYFSMPKGTYDSVQIVLGNGNGENWWSLVFPYSYDGYCVANDNISLEEALKSDINDFSYIDKSEIKYKSGILEKIKDVLKK